MKNEIDSREQDSLYRELADKDIVTIKKIVNWIVKANKNYGLYPQNHSILRNSVKKVKIELDAFLNSHEELRFVVKRDRLVFQGEVVHLGLPEEDNLAFLLFRDGIQWIEFQKGLAQVELEGFFDILKSNRDITEESESDLVTALWEKNFPHLLYDAPDVLWEDTPLIDFSNLNKDTEDPVACEQQETENQQEVDHVSIADMKVSFPLWEITPEELEGLRKRVRDYESVENQDDVLDVLSIILETQNTPEDFTSILDFLKVEFRNALESGEFGIATKFIKNIKALYDFLAGTKPWAASLIEKFLSEISSEAYIDLLQPHWSMLDNKKSKKAQTFFSYLRNLPPVVIPYLMMIVMETRSPTILQRLMKVIKHLAARDIRPLEELLKYSQNNLIYRVINILGQMKSEKSKQLLKELIYHPIEGIRQKALQSLVANDAKMLQEMFELIDDSNTSIRQLMLEHIGKSRQESTEDLMLEYLQNRNYKISTGDHLLACYKILGKCGSRRSVAFLQSTLFARFWLSFLVFRPSVHRKGAATALRKLELEEASEILVRGSKSLSLSIRRACRNAYKEKKNASQIR